MEMQLKDSLESAVVVLNKVLEGLNPFPLTKENAITSVKSWSLVLTSYFVLRYVTKTMYRRYKRYPNGPFDWIPFFGLGFQVFSEPFCHVSGYYGAITYCRAFGNNIVLINDSHVAKHEIMNRKEFMDHITFIPESGLGRPKLLPLLQECDSGHDSKNLAFVLVNGKLWKERRQYAASVLIRQCDSKLTSSIIEDAMKNTVFVELDKLSLNKQAWYPKQLLAYLAFNTIYQANFGVALDINDPKLSELRDLIRERFSLTRYTQIPILFPFTIHLFQFTSYYKQVIEINKKRTEAFSKILNERRELYKNNEAKLTEMVNDHSKHSICYVDYLLYLLDYAKPKTVNEAQVISDMSVLFGAGTDTTSSTLEYIIYLLMKNPNMQEKIYQELKTITKGDANNYSVSTFSRSSVYKAFIYECLRISCVAPRGLPHTCQKDVTVKMNENETVVIPKGSIININITYIMRGDSPNEHWKNKEHGLSMTDICLENWLVNGKFKMNESFILFGTGKRDCVGQQVAMKEIYLITGFLMLHYQFSAKNKDTSFHIERRAGLTAEVANDIPVFVTKRV